MFESYVSFYKDKLVATLYAENAYQKELEGNE